ncbi:MAG: hypothetical protein ACE15F_25105 [bacterium]
MSDSTLSILLITEDETLHERCVREFRARFNLEVHRYQNTYVKETLRVFRPAAVIWDGRRLPPRWVALVAWMREHFPKRPVIALLDGENEEVSRELHRLGVTAQLDAGSDSFFETLQMHLFAVVLDCERHRREPAPG